MPAHESPPVAARAEQIVRTTEASSASLNHPKPPSTGWRYKREELYEWLLAG